MRRPPHGRLHSTLLGVAIEGAPEKAIVALLWIEKVYGTPVHAIVEKLRAATISCLMGWMKASSPKATSLIASGECGRRWWRNDGYRRRKRRGCWPNLNEALAKQPPDAAASHHHEQNRQCDCSCKHCNYCCERKDVDNAIRKCEKHAFPLDGKRPQPPLLAGAS